jgi:hypothetical protein
MDCPDGTYKNDILQECSDCDPECSICFGSGTNNCLRCLEHPPGT